MTKPLIFATCLALFWSQLSSASDNTGRVLPQFRDFEVTETVALKDVNGGNLSGITYNFDTQTYFLIQNNYETLFEYDRSFSKPLRVIKFLNLEDDDTEDIVYLGQGRFALSSETNKIIIFSIWPGQTEIDLNPARPDVQLFQLPRPSEKNQGLEGVCFNPMSDAGQGRFYAVQQNRPRLVYSFARPNHDNDVVNYKYLRLQQPFDTVRLFKHRMSSLASCTFSETTGTLLILSSVSSRVMELSLDGKSVETLDIPPVAPQYEGITLNPDGEMILVSEPNVVVVLKPKSAKTDQHD